MLGLLTSSMKRTSIFGSPHALKIKLVFVDVRGIVDKSKEASPSNIDPRVKKKKSIKGMSVRQHALLCSIWRIINLHTLRVAKD